MSELIDIVNEQDEVIGTMTRDDPSHVDYITRNVVVSLRNSQGDHIIQVRSQTKKHWPGCFDLAACGGVKAGESYEDAAERELFEELGVRTHLASLVKYPREVEYKGGNRRLFTQLFLGRYDGGFARTDEVDDVLKLSTGELRRLIAQKDPRVQPYFVEEVALFSFYWS